MVGSYELKVYPVGWGKKAYRVILISGDRTLDTLCSAILEAFDFDEDHLYEFCMDNKLYGRNTYQSHPEFGGRSANKKLDDLGLKKGQKFLLHYDFGDDWQFSIQVQNMTSVSKSFVPSVIKSKGSVVQYPEWDDEEYWDGDEE